jgi:hypothetical protein
LGWRDRVLMAAESALKERERDARDDSIARLKLKVPAAIFATWSGPCSFAFLA